MNSADDDFAKLFFAHDGLVSDKWAQYLPVYTAELAEFRGRGKPVRLLEIGVQNGGSLQLWTKYLPPGSEVIGVDVDPRCRDLPVAPARVLIADAATPGLLPLLPEGEFDIIIDDGSHRPDDVRRSFELLLPRLANGGKYIVEDLHCSYQAAYGGGYRAPGSTMSWITELLDGLHWGYLDQLPTEEAERLHLVYRRIGRVSVYDSLLVLAAYDFPRERNFPRAFSGSDERVVSTTAFAATQPSSDRISASAFATRLERTTETLLGEAARRVEFLQAELKRARLQILAQGRALSVLRLLADFAQVGVNLVDGWLDLPSEHIRGWAYCALFPQARLEILVTVRGVEVARTRADLPRPDLVALGVGDGNYGFELPRPTDAGADGVQVWVEAAGRRIAIPSVDD